VTLEAIWQQKSDKQLEIAAAQLADYTEEAQQIIREEIRRRGMPEPPTSPVLPTYRQPSRLRYAGFWLRFCAAFLDGIILRIINLFLAYLVTLLYIKITGETKAAESVGVIVGILVSWLYYAFLESSAEQATLGKQALGIVVTDLDGYRISFGQATARYFSKWLSALTFFVGYIMAGLTKKHQALHDMIAGTLVIKKSSFRSRY
jgi:uncharacterized RDD family membrane protein YckC